MWRLCQYPGPKRYTRVAINDAFKHMTDVEAVPISPTAAVHKDEVSKPQINDAFKHMTDTKQKDVQAVPISPTAAVHQGYSVGSKQDEMSKPQINDAFKHMTDTKQDVEAVPISPTAAVHQGCSVGSKQDEVSKTQINDAFKYMTAADSSDSSHPFGLKSPQESASTISDVEAVPISPTAAVHQGCSVGSKLNEFLTKLAHLSRQDSKDEEEIHEADDLTEKEDMETVPGCSVRSNPDKWQKPAQDW
ncbi:hypothetical protein DPMN_047879 [Dreissena polymorpha]|uniref:Uncharacterized protein n=1 Tax=Dreissena polymorpha TaxID=45954 RepID=A0A9D4I1U1_DREPO|nr:hypothetical protein DPMN_047879 [Dreissena polymorpha]